MRDSDDIQGVGFAGVLAGASGVFSGALGSLGIIPDADGLSLDLQFATDKTLTARKGPTPTFTRASSGTFVGSNGLIQSAAINAPRFDHDPLTLACKGLLIEEQRINVCLQSENLGTTWTQNYVSASLNVAVAPDGNTTADKIVENTASAIHGVDQQTTFTAVPYTLSFYAKKDGRTWIRAFFSGLASTWFNIDSGTVGTVASGFTASIVDAGNGWYRCSISGTAAAGTLSSGVRMATGDGINTYLGDGVSGVFLWGAQLEAGAFPTSYIPTTTGSVTRSADVCSITGSAFTSFYNPLEGSLFTNTIFNAPAMSGPAQRIWELSSASTLNSSRAFRSGVTGSIGFRNTSASVTDVSLDTIAYPPSQQAKQSFGFVNNNFAYYLNDTEIGIDALCSIPASLNALYIGSSSPIAGGGGQLNGTFASLRYFRKRLSNAKLQTLTT